MKLIITKNSDEIAVALVSTIIGFLEKKPNLVLGLATGSSPIQTYKLLIEDHQTNKTDWSNVITFNLDEYIGLSLDNKNSYHYFMYDQLFNHLNIKKENIHIPNGIGDSEQNAFLYEQQIKEYGPIDLQILGIGNNGHIAFNEPGSDINSITRVVELSDDTKAANKRFFAGQVPQQAITMGIATILKANNIILIASGKNKAQAIKELVHGKVSEQWPCTYLQNHKNVLLLIDQDAASLLDQSKIS